MNDQHRPEPPRHLGDYLLAPRGLQLAGRALAAISAARPVPQEERAELESAATVIPAERR